MYQKLLEKKPAQVKLKLTAKDFNVSNIADTRVSIPSFHGIHSLDCDGTQSPNASRFEPHECSGSLGYA